MEAYNETALEIEGERDYWTVSTGQMVWKNRLTKLANDYPDKVKLKVTNADGSIVCHIPKAWVTIRPPKKGKPSTMTAEERAAFAEKMKAARLKPTA